MERCKGAGRVLHLERAAGTEATILLTAVAPKENGTSPAVIFHSESAESSIRMTATNPATKKIPNAFHIGTVVPGPGAEDKAIFFIWSDVNGFVVEVDPAGNLIARRNMLNVRGMKAAEPTQLTSLKDSDDRSRDRRALPRVRRRTTRRKSTATSG